MEGLLKTDIPSKLSGSRQNPPWINTELKRQIRRKGSLLNLFGYWTLNIYYYYYYYYY